MATTPDAPIAHHKSALATVAKCGEINPAVAYDTNGASAITCPGCIAWMDARGLA